MKKNMFKFSSLGLIALATVVMFSITSCGDDDPVVETVMGCMDEAAANFNAAATVDDGSCTYEGKALFAGTTKYDYLGAIACDTTGIICSVINTDSLAFEVIAGAGENDVTIILNSGGAAGAAFQGIAIGNELTIDATIEAFPTGPLAALMGAEGTVDLVVSGTATYNNSDDSMAGVLNIGATVVSPAAFAGIALPSEATDFSGVKVQ